MDYKLVRMDVISAIVSYLNPRPHNEVRPLIDALNNSRDVLQKDPDQEPEQEQEKEPEKEKNI